MSMNLVTLLYLVASVCFIQALKGLSHPTTSIRGNLFGMIGMAIAVLTTGALIVELSGGKSFGMVYVLGGLLVGGSLGAYMANKVEMTKMPELVAFMHSMIGLAAVFIAVAAVAEPYAFGIVPKGVDIPTGNRLELFLGAAIGAITFSGSVIAFGKLSGKYKFRLFQGAPVQFAGQHKLNLVLGLTTLGLGLAFMFTGSWPAFFAMLALAFVLGVLIIIPIGGADMPVVVSHAQQLLRLAAGSGHWLLAEQQHADHRRLAGGQLRRRASCRYIMCQGDEPLVLQRDSGRALAARLPRRGWQREMQAQHEERSDADDAGICVEQRLRPWSSCRATAWRWHSAQHAVKELAAKLYQNTGIDGQVRDPSGRRPHARPHERAAGRGRRAVRHQVLRHGRHQRGVQGQADVAIVLGANDAVNPAARTRQGERRSTACRSWRPTRPRQVYRQQARPWQAGYAGLDNELFYMDKTMMVFGDAKKVVEDMGKAIE